jgi:hypothetical protein
MLIALQPRECCYLNEEKGWRECNPICIFRYLLSSDLKSFAKKLEPILTSSVVMALLSPHPILPPHGLTPITHAPQCLLGILINVSRVEEATNILQYLFTTLFAAIATQLGLPIVPEQQYIDTMLTSKVREVIGGAQKLRVGSIEVLSIDLKQSYGECLSYFRELCEKESDEMCLRELEELQKNRI